MKEEKIPSLTEKIRIFALGGLDEDGRRVPLLWRWMNPSM